MNTLSKQIDRLANTIGLEIIDVRESGLFYKRGYVLRTRPREHALSRTNVAYHPTQATMLEEVVRRVERVMEAWEVLKDLNDARDALAARKVNAGRNRHAR